jgi:hypothetical protein
MDRTHAPTASRRAAETRAAGDARTRRFDDALRAARRAEGRAAADAAGSADAPAAPATRRRLADRKDLDLDDRREGFRAREREETPRVAPPPPQTTPSAPRLEPTPPGSELRALVRTLPVAVEAARVRAGAPLALDLGRALSVELRQAPGGLELVLRPDAALSRAAEAELPAVVRALRDRGLAVARAEVRARPDGGSPAPAGPRVDGPPGVG